VFGVETIHLDLPPLAGSLGQRLRAAGVPVTPERSADFARALKLVRPNSRRRLYWTARSVFVTDQSHARAFDEVFRAIFGDPAAPDATRPDDAQTVAAPPDERPVPDHATSSGEPAQGDRRASVASSTVISRALDPSSWTARAEQPFRPRKKEKPSEIPRVRRSRS